MKIHHLNCGNLHVPPNARAVCHCVLIEDRNGLALVDTGIGLADVRDPLGRIGQELIDLVGYQFDERLTAIRQIESLGLRPEDVQHIVITHGDPDHTGGLADFPQAQVHLASEELAAIERGSFRYLPTLFAHAPRWNPIESRTRDWFGLEARVLPLGFESEVLLIPLFGHTLGHSGIAIQTPEGWLLHAGDAYYLRIELKRDDHPISQLTAQRAEDNAARIASLTQLKRLAREHANEIRLFGYHDETELPGAIGSAVQVARS